VLDSVRLSRDFFDLGPFRSEGLTLVGSGDAATAALRESVAGDYYQPLAPSRREPLGSYQVTDNGRFSAAMDFALRETHQVSLTTTVDARISDTSVEIVLEIAGPPVGWALELAFRPGGELVGADPLGEHRWQLAASGSAVYAVGEDSIAVTVVEAGDGMGGALVLSDAPPAYDPGEDYRFLGGTDAATGELLYVAGRAPSRLVVRLEPAQATGQSGYPVPDH
jgi:hypothetical protein